KPPPLPYPTLFRSPDREHEEEELQRRADRRRRGRAEMPDECEDRRLPGCGDDVLDDPRPGELERGPLRMERRKLRCPGARPKWCFRLLFSDLRRGAQRTTSTPLPATTSPIAVAPTSGDFTAT